MNPFAWCRTPSPAQQVVDSTLATLKNEPAPNLGSDAVTKFVKPLRCTASWLKPVVWGTVSLAAGALTAYVTYIGTEKFLGEAPGMEMPILTGATIAATVSQNMGGTVLGNANAMFWTMFTVQGTAQVVGTLGKFAIEQGMMAANRLLPGINCTDVDISGNTTEALFCNSPEVLRNMSNPDFANSALPLQSDWPAMLVGAIPLGLMFLDTFVAFGGRTSISESLASLAEYNVQNPARLERNSRTGTAIRLGVPAAASTLLVGTLALGHHYGGKKLLFRMMSGAVQTMIANRTRDFLTQNIRDISRSSALTAQRPRERLRSQTMVKIPRAVLDELKKQCGNNPNLLTQAMAELGNRYTATFHGARGVSNIGYLATGIANGYVLRAYFAPSMSSVFAGSIQQMMQTSLVGVAGTAMNEGFEDFSAAVAQKLVAGGQGVPYELKTGKPWPEVWGTLRSNLSTTHVLAWLPILRHLSYTPSKVEMKDGKPTPNISTSDKIELNYGIRALQNLPITFLFTASGAVGGNETTPGRILMGAGILVVAATHWRGVTVAQILTAGHEAKLLYNYLNGQSSDVEAPPAKDEVSTSGAGQKKSGAASMDGNGGDDKASTVIPVKAADKQVAAPAPKPSQSGGQARVVATESSSERVDESSSEKVEVSTSDSTKNSDATTDDEAESAESEKIVKQPAPTPSGNKTSAPSSKVVDMDLNIQTKGETARSELLNGINGQKELGRAQGAILAADVLVNCSPAAVVSLCNELNHELAETGKLEKQSQDKQKRTDIKMHNINLVLNEIASLQKYVQSQKPGTTSTVVSNADIVGSSS